MSLTDAYWQFDDDYYTNIAFPEETLTGSWTIEMYLSVSGTPTYCTPLTSASLDYYIRRFRIDSDRACWIIEADGNQNTSSYVDIYPQGEFSWWQITYDGSVVRFYMDGVLQWYGSYTISEFVYQFLFRNSPGFAGKIASMRVWDAVLSQTTLAANLETEYTGSESNLIHLYDFNGNVNDLAGSMDGTANNGTFYTTATNTAPTISAVSGVTGTTNNDSATFSWSGSDVDDNLDHYEYKKDSGDWVNCGLSTSYTWDGYSEASHTFYVKAVDTEDAESSVISWSFTYAIPEYTLSISTESATEGLVAIGSNTPASSDSTTVDTGTYVSFEATPESGYQFDGWYESGIKISPNALFGITLDSNRTLEARFEAETTNIDPVVSKYSGATGTIEDASTTFEWIGYDEDGSISLYEYKKDSGAWTSNGTSTSYTWSGYSEAAHTFSVRATDNDSGVSDIVTWSFTYSAPVNEKTITLTASPNAGGDVQIDSGGWVNSDSKTVTYDTSVTIEARTAEGYTFEGWYQGLTKHTETNPYTFNLTDDLDLIAVFYTPTEEGIYLKSTESYVNHTDRMLNTRLKFERSEGAIGHTEAIADFTDDVSVSRGDTLKITTRFNDEIFLTVEKVNTSETKRRRVVAKDAIYFKKDKPLPAAVFVDVTLSQIFSWVATNGGFEGYDVTPYNASDPEVPFYYVEEGTKLGELLEEIAEAIQGPVFTAVTHEASEGNRLIFNVACLKPFNNDALMTLTADQLGSDELSDLPRKHNQFSLKFKKKTQIPDTLVFRGASVDDTFDVPATGYPESEDDSYYAEFEHAVISITDHSFDGMNCYIDQTVWQSNFEESGVNYGTLKDPYKFKLRFMPYDDFGGTIYDLRLYGNAIKEDETTETLDVSGTDYAKEKEYQNDLVSTDLNWHKFFLAWVTSKSTQERKITVVDPNENFVSLMTLMYGTSVNQDNRVISIDGVKMTVESATWAMTKERWELSGRQTRTSTTFTEYVEKQKANNIFDDMQKKLIVAFDVAHPNADTPDEVTQQIDIPTEKNINNYTVEIDPVYMKGTTNTAKYVAFNFQRRQFEFEAYAGLPPENVTDIGYTLDDSVLADNVFGSYSRLFYPNPADVTVDAENGRQLGSFNVKFYRKSDSAFVGEYYDVLDGYWPAMYLAFMIKRNLNYGYTYAKVKGYSPGYNPSEGPYIVIAPEDIYYASQLYAVLDKVQIEADSFEPLQGTFRFKIFQDINQRKNDGILGSAPSRTSIGGSTPMTFSISTVPDSFNPAFEETEYVVYETYTQVEFKNASGVTVKRVIIRNSTESGYIEGVAYRYTTYDDYKYFAYKYQNGTRKTIDCYDPYEKISSVVISPKE